MAILWKIKEIKGTDTLTIEEFLEQLDLRPFQKMDCDSYLYEVTEEINFRPNFIFYNNRSDTAYFNLRNSTGKVLSEKLSLAPHSFVLNEWRFGNNRSIKILSNDSCHEVCRRSKKDYLIFYSTGQILKFFRHIRQ